MSGPSITHSMPCCNKHKRSFSEPPRGRRRHVISIVLPNSVDNELVELTKCCICYEVYNKTARAPISMTCGHTLCKRCVGMLNADIFFCCPICRTVSVLGHDDWKKNLTLLQIMEKLDLLADDSQSTTTSPRVSRRNREEYVRILTGVKPMDALKYTGSFLDIMTDYLVYKIADCLDTARDRMNQYFDDFLEAARPISINIYSFIGWNDVADMLRNDGESQAAVNPEAQFERVVSVDGAQGDGPAQAIDIEVKAAETDENGTNNQEIA